MEFKTHRGGGGYCKPDAPQIKLPTSNNKTDVRKLNLRSKYWYTFPHVDWKTAKVMKNPEAYQPMSPTDFEVMFRIAPSHMEDDQVGFSDLHEIHL